MLPDLLCYINRNFTEIFDVANISMVLLFRWHNETFLSRTLTADILIKGQVIDCEEI